MQYITVCDPPASISIRLVTAIGWLYILEKKAWEKAEIFHKIEPYSTFLNIHQLERQVADIQTKVGVRSIKSII